MSSEGREYSDPRETDEDLDDESKERMRELAERLKVEMDEDETREDEEANRKMRKLADELEREWQEDDEKSTGENSKEEDEDAQDVLDKMSEARNDLHERFVHDMHEECPAKEAFSEEGRRYYEQDEVSEDTESSESEESCTESRDGTMQVLKDEKESSTTTESAPEFTEDEKESSEEKEKGESLDTSRTEENRKENEPDSQTSESVDNEELKKSDGTRTDDEIDKEIGEEGQSRRRRIEQSSLEEFVDNEATEGKSENTGGGSIESSCESTQSHEQGANSVESKVNPDYEATNADEDDINHESNESPQRADSAEENEIGEDEEQNYDALEHEDNDPPIQFDDEAASLDDCDEQEEIDSWDDELESTNQTRIEGSKEEEEFLSESSEYHREPNEEESEEYTLPSMLPQKMSFSMFPEEESEEDASQILLESWESLSEEEKEEIKPILQNEIESEEELDEALETFSKVRYSSDFEEDLEDAREYLSLTEEERELTEPPRLLQRLKELEAERRWAEYLLFRSIGDLSHIDTSSKPEGKRWGKHREIRLYKFFFNGKHVIKTSEAKAIVKFHYPGFLERSDFDKLWKNISDFMELSKRLSGRRSVRQYEIDNLADELGINRSTATKWVFCGIVPALFKWMDKAISKLDGIALSNLLRTKIDGMETWADVEARLDKIDGKRAYQRTKNFSREKRRATKFLEFLVEVEKGGTLKGIASKLGITRKAAEEFSKGNIPGLIRAAIPSLKESKRHETFKKVRLKLPEIRGKCIKSYKSLLAMIHASFPFLLEYNDIDALLEDARMHQMLITRFSKIVFITKETVSEISRETRLSYGKIKGYLLKGKRPLLYEIIDNALSVDEANKRYQTILENLNGITGMRELNRRLGHLYMKKELALRPRHKDDVLRAKKFFRFIKALRGGGSLSDVAKRAGLNADDIRGWFKTPYVPRLVRFVASVPIEAPREGRKWLPLRATNEMDLEGFIQVPIKIASESDILEVLDQLTPLASTEFEEYENDFGGMTQLMAFMYALGAIVSDGWFEQSSPISRSVGLAASTAYFWSKDFGSGFCYALRKIGISANYRGIREVMREGKLTENHGWSSTSTPLLLWIKKTLLGLDKVPKSQTKIRAPWILNISQEARIAFLQGLSDGDGFASMKHLVTGISTKVNQRSFMRILKSLGIHSVWRKKHVRIHRIDAIRRAEKLPLFRHAIARQERLAEITSFLKAQTRRSPVKKELGIIMSLAEKGHSLGEITEILWKKYGYARRPTSVSDILKKYRQ